MHRNINTAKYREVKASGLLDNDGLKLYELLLLNGPLTGGELCDLSRKETKHKVSRHGLVSRMAALRRKGLIDKVDPVVKRKCGVSGKYAFVWDVTAGDTVAALACLT